MELSDHIVFRNPYHVTTNPLEDTLVALNLKTGLCRSMGRVGMEIWRLLVDEHMTITQTCSRLIEEYDVDADTCHIEVRAFVKELLDARFLEAGAVV